MNQKQRILAVLDDGDWHTSAELYRTGCVLHSRISDLRNKDGYTIERRNVGGVGAEAHEYRLVGRLDVGVEEVKGETPPPTSSRPAELAESDGGALGNGSTGPRQGAAVNATDAGVTPRDGSGSHRATDEWENLDTAGQLTLTGGAFMRRRDAA